MENQNMPNDIFDGDDIDSPLDLIDDSRNQAAAPRPRPISPLPAQEPQSRQPITQAAPEPKPTPQSQTQQPRAPRTAKQPESQSRQAERRVEHHPDAPTASRKEAPLDTSLDLSFFTDGRFTKLAGVCLIFAAIYMLVVSLSFFSAGAIDQSAVGIDGEPVKNIGGPLGALTGQALISRWLGLGAFIIIFLIGALGIALVKLKRFNIIGLITKSLIGAISLSIIAGYISMHLVSHFPLGGLHGYYINMSVINLTGEFGACLLSLLLLALLVIIFLKEVTTAYKSIVNAYRKLRQSVAEENMRRRQQASSNSSRTPGSTVPEVKDEGNEPATQQEGNDSMPETHSEEEEPALEPPTDKEIHQPIVVDNERLRSQMARREMPQPATSAPSPRPRRELEDFEVDDTPIVGSDIPYTAPPVHDSYAATSYQAPTQPAAQAPHTVQPMTIPDPLPTASIPATTPIAPTPFPPAAVPQSPVAEETPMTLDSLEEPEMQEPPTEDPDRITPAPQASAPSTPNPATQVTDTFRTAPDIVEATTINSSAYDPTAELSHFRFPSLDSLHDRKPKATNIDMEEQEANKQRIRATLSSFGIEISHIEATIGPTVTLYEVVPCEGVRISKIKNLEDDIARSIAAIGTRIIAPIPGKETVGIEVPNKDPQVVPIRTILASEAYQNCKMALPMAMGATISNEVYIADLTKMPHLLVAGATGMGKSVGLNTIITSLLFKKHPAELKFVLIDPKMVEFSLYKKLERHYLAKLPDEEEPIITDPNKVVPTLNSLCVEMDNRYQLLKQAYVRSISEYNSKFTSRVLNPNEGHRFLPYIVVVVDEFADLIMTAGREVEQPIARIAQKARAVGIHLILATQRPSTNVITGIIKANFPGRIAFRVFQMVDSRTIIDRPGANQLIGRGDMLFSRDGVIDRVQCALIETDEVESICDEIASQIGYEGAYELPLYEPEGVGDGVNRAGSLNDFDPLFPDAARYVVTANQASTTSLQRHYEIGYPRAGKIMDQLEKAGVVGPAQGSKPRAVLLDPIAVERLLESIGLN